MDATRGSRQRGPGPFMLQGGTVCDALGTRRADVVVEDGLVRAVGACDTVEVPVLDASECYVIPGLVDLHTHVREPGDVAVESIQSAAEAAARGGYTCITVMPNTEPPIAAVEVVAQLRPSVRQACVEVHVASSLTQCLDGVAAVDVDALVGAGIRYFVDETRGIPGDAVMEAVMARAGASGALVGAYCFDESLAEHGVAHEGPIARSLGLKGIPSAAEETVVERSVALAERLGAPLHLLSVSTAGSIEQIRAAKRRGVCVTAEIAPHHLLLSDEALRTRSPRFKMKPPLRSEADRRAAVAGLADGTLDVIVTDHAPHATATKTCAFEQGSFGVIGLETALPWVMSRLDLPIERLVQTMSTAPAALAGYRDQGGPIAVGRPANLCVIAPEERWRVDSANFASRSANCPIDGEWLTGRVRHTIAAGTPVVVDGELQSATQQGSPS